MNIFHSDRVQAAEWNRSIGPKLQRARIMAGRNTKITRTPCGQSISFPESGRWRHPWYTQPVYLGHLKQWVATVKPGYVNGEVPIYQSTVVEAEEMPDYGINPLNGERHFSAWVFRQAEIKETHRRIDIPLYGRPAIKLNWRKLGLDGDPGEPVPKFFRDRGVQEAPNLQESLLGGRVNIDSIEKRANSRLLRACDIVLHQPRQALTSHVTFEPGIVTGSSNVTQTLSLRSAVAGDRLQIQARAKYNAFDAFTSAINPLAGDYEEPTWDEVLVSTIFLLSPVTAQPDSMPDHTWTPFVRHNLFWNLSYAQPELRMIDSDPSIPYIPPLAAGAGQLVINFVTSSINDITRQMINILQAHSMSGHFWVATGGGSTSEIPVAATSPQSASGLDKAGRLQAQRQAQIAALRAEKLDPEFPYHTPAFPLSLL